jgi:hypothetical protein
MTITVEHPAGMWRPRWSRVHHAAERPGPRQPRRHRCHPWQLLAPRERSWRQRRRRGHRGWRAAGRRHEDVPLVPTMVGLPPPRAHRPGGRATPAGRAAGTWRVAPSGSAAAGPRLERRDVAVLLVTTDCAALDAPGVSARDLVRFSRWRTGSEDGRTSRGRSPSRLATVVRGQAGTVRVLGAWSGAMRPSGPALGAAW